MSKMKNNVCRFVIVGALAGLYLTVGGMESFQIGIGEGVAAMAGCFAAMIAAGIVGCEV